MDVESCFSSDDESRQLPPLPPSTKMTDVLHLDQELTPKSTKHAAIMDSIEYFLHKLQHDSPANGTLRLSRESLEQQKLGRILEHFQDNLSSFQKHDKYSIFGVK